MAGTPEEEVEPMYGPLYLPRKFKIGIAVPPSNDIDVFSQDLGFIAIVEDGKLIGFNVAIGGGMGMTHGDTATYPQLAKVIGFCRPERMYDVAEKTITIQRDYGNRSVRKNARFKYTVDRLGLETVKKNWKTVSAGAWKKRSRITSTITATVTAGWKALRINGILHCLSKAAV